MKKSSKIASIICAIALLVSMMSVGFGASAVDASSGQSSLKGVTLSGSTISGTFSVYGWLNTIEARVGNGESGQVVGTYNPASWETSGSFSIPLSDGGKSTTGYSVILTNTTGSEKVIAYIPYTGPVYKMEIQKNGSAITSYDLGMNEGTVSGFSFVAEGTYTVTTSGSAATMNRSGDTFTLTPKSIGTFTITATCKGVTSTTLTVNVTDDSSIKVQWYDTGKEITNNAVVKAQAGIAYGFGVEAYPAGYTVALSNNTADAKYSSSTVAGQYPNTIKANKEGSVKVTVTGASKTVNFTINFSAPAEPAFDFFTDSACNNVAEPLVQVEKNASITIYTNKAVSDWAATGSGATISNHASKSVTVQAGSTPGALVTITATLADGTTKFFDVYVTGSGSVVPPVDNDFFLFKNGYIDFVNSNYGTFQATAEVTFYQGKLFIPLRSGADATECSNFSFANGKVSFKTKAGNTIYMTMDSINAKFTDSTGKTSDFKLVTAPTYINGKAYLPIRDLGIVTTNNTYFDDSTGYALIYTGELTQTQIDSIIASNGSNITK